jgi:hypothetical protein
MASCRNNSVRNFLTCTPGSWILSRTFICASIELKKYRNSSPILSATCGGCFTGKLRRSSEPSSDPYPGSAVSAGHEDFGSCCTAVIPRRRRLCSPLSQLSGVSLNTLQNYPQHFGGSDAKSLYLFRPIAGRENLCSHCRAAHWLFRAHGPSLHPTRKASS